MTPYGRAFPAEAAYLTVVLSVSPGVATSCYYDHASHLVQFAGDLLHKVKALPLINNHRLHIRIGINSGE